MRTFGTHGPVNPKENYIVKRSQETEDFIQRIKNGKYIVIFAPRQTGKTTFFQQAVDILTTQEHDYFPIQLNVETYATLTGSDFYSGFSEDVHEAIDNVFHRRKSIAPAALTQFLENAKLTNAVAPGTPCRDGDDRWRENSELCHSCHTRSPFKKIGD